MQFIIKLAITVAVIIISAQIGKRFPSLAGLIGTMPLTGLLVLIWLYTEKPGDMETMTDYTKGALFGVFPSIMFYLVAWMCFRRGMSLPGALTAGFGVWIIGAFLHQMFLK
jgi:uncharacterized membrane protein (GlpM family)